MPSRLSRARGLKLVKIKIFRRYGRVAPFTGAWIETFRIFLQTPQAAGSRLSRARGLKRRGINASSEMLQSRLSRARGLKLLCGAGLPDVRQVAPFTGA